MRALSDIDHLEKAELTLAIEQLKKNKAADRAGLIAEMIKYGPDILHDHLLKIFNNVILKKEMVSADLTYTVKRCTVMLSVGMCYNVM